MVPEIMMIGAMAFGMDGLGASVVTGQKLTPEQIYSYARAAGFPTTTATQMTAIALRESSGYTGALNTGTTANPETSKGLWQINVNDAGVRNLLTNSGVDINNLNDPAVNAQAAYVLWGGNDNNLNVAWYIDRPGYMEKYLANLPIAEEAAASVDGGGYNGDNISGWDLGAGLDLDLSAIPDWAPMAAVAAGLLAYVALR